MHTSTQLGWVMRFGLAPFPGCQGSCAIVPNGPTGSVASFNIRLGLKCKHVASTLILNMWLLCSNCALPWTNKFLDVFSKTDIAYQQQRSLLHPRASAEFSEKMRKFLRSLAEYLTALAFLCCHYIFDSHMACLTLTFIVLNSKSILKPHSNLFGASLDAL